MKFVHGFSHEKWLFGLCYAMDGDYKGCNPYLVGIEVKTTNESYTSKCSFLMISPKLYAIWPVLFLILPQDLIVVLLMYFVTLGDG